MASILKVDTIQDQAGNNIINESANTITIGASGDTINVVGTLQNNGNNAVGITEADQWRLTADQSGGTNAVISSNLERVDNTTFAKIGTGMTESSGEFSFPSTGLYYIAANAMIRSNNDQNSYVKIQISTNSGSTYSDLAIINGGSTTDENTVSVIQNIFVNVTNISTYRVQFTTSTMGASSFISGNTSANYTTFTFIRLGDSV